ncbi:MAG: WecB/TagA/CpsF family glycosyltransferase [Synergistaceae bacterium]|nr:WecB/TagA/CpsF family glycosyltransferase [Synergistaceae bacterium]
MIVSYDLQMIAGCVGAAALCVLVQYAVKRYFDPRQYAYLRDLLLVGGWLLLAIWFGSPQSRFVAGAAFLAGIVGLTENFWPGRPGRWGYLFIGFCCALFGPSISFISFVDGEYIYLTPLTSVIVTTLWFALFPVILQQLDAIPGLVGYMLAVTFSLMLISVVLAVRGMEDAFFMSFAGLVLLGAFWSRFSDFYRQAGRTMSAMWGTLAAGTAILGVSKGIVFSSMLYLSLGLFAIPMAEASLHLANLFFSDTPHGTERLYRKLIRNGLEHPDAVRFIAGLCAFLGIATALSQYSGDYTAWIWWGGAFVLVVVVPLAFKYRNRSPMFHGKPCLWGVHIDNMSLNYALARARGLILSSGETKKETKLVSTVNALGMDEAVCDPEYHRILRHSAMVLSDGVGLLWGLRFLGMPIQERVTGIDFAEQLCRMAAAEGWPVYFLGSRGKTALTCSKALAARYPGLVVAGARDGYFAMDDPSVADVVAHSGAKILFVAMGIPRQEKWVDRHGKSLGSVLAVGVGGAFDVLSGHLKRSPRILQKLGLEWFFRLCQEPYRWKKDVRLFFFVARVLATRIGLYTWKGEDRG